MEPNIVHNLASLSDYYYKNFDEAALDAILFFLSKLCMQVLGVVEPKAPMEYYSIYETKSFHICIIVLRKGSIIPLHDHPGMVVLSKLVTGTIKTELYQWLNSKSTNFPTNQAVMIEKKVISSESPDSLMRIFSDSGPSLHAFECVSDYAVIVDVLGPPYGEDRCCKYYNTWDECMLQDKRVITLKEFQHEDQDVVEHPYRGEKVIPELFYKTAVDILSLLNPTHSNVI